MSDSFDELRQTLIHLEDLATHPGYVVLKVKWNAVLESLKDHALSREGEAYDSGAVSGFSEAMYTLEDYLRELEALLSSKEREREKKGSSDKK